MAANNLETGSLQTAPSATVSVHSHIKSGSKVSLLLELKQPFRFSRMGHHFIDQPRCAEVASNRVKSSIVRVAWRSSI